ncbi:hypothetical protein Mgra_00002394 [Meloidogyne graminicola]|uniref:Uncharacterized protein n=1 Tax=Meloidogyne graminicola TaxID=189291 RepID=A0A8S9ZY06_9BILA|nr:hypothetical protein Mgra_00002394 [Meloidogyne graminicola]
MRRCNSDSSVPHLLRCRLCRERSEQAYSFITAKMEFSEIICDRLEADVAPSVYVCLSCDRINKPNHNNGISNSKATSTHFSSSSIGKANFNSPSTKLSKILMTWPFLRLKEATSKEGELSEACRQEMERRQRNYRNWKLTRSMTNNDISLVHSYVCTFSSVKCWRLLALLKLKVVKAMILLKRERLRKD